MGKEHVYNVKSTKDSTDVFIVTKFDEDLTPVDSYHISELHGGGMICQCPAGSKPTCRHRQMLRLFQAEQRVDSPYIYHYDKKKWLKLNQF